MGIKKQIQVYSFYDLDGMKDHLEVMARKGWFPRKLGTFLWQYEQGEPKELIYSVTSCGEAAAYTPKAEQKQTSFRSSAEARGWTLAASNQKLQIYASEQNQEGTVSVSSYDRITGIKQAARPAMILYITMIVLALFSILVLSLRMSMMPVGVLTDSFGLAIGTILTVMSLYAILDMIFYYSWKNRAEIAATRNEYEKTGSHTLRVLKVCIAAAALLLGVIVFASGRSPLVKTFIGYLIGILALFFILTVIRVRMIRKGKSAASMKKASRIINVIVAVVLVGGITLSLNQMRQDDRGANGEMPVSVENLFYDAGDREVEGFSRSKETFLMGYSEAYETAIQEDGSYETLLSYEIADSKAVPVEGRVLDYYLHRTEGVEIREDGTPIYQYREMDPALWKAEKAWRMHRENEAQNVYLLLYKDRLVELGAAWALTEQQMRICGENFGS